VRPLLFCHFDHFPAFVLAAVGAYPVGELLFVAVGALGKAGLAQKIVGPALGPALG
jgi:hypothetical protein